MSAAAALSVSTGEAPKPRPLVSIRDVSKQFANGTIAVRDVNLDLARGEFVSLLGPSGCGKSTLLRMISGLGEPSRGTIEWPTSPHDAEGHASPDLGFVFQEPTLMPWATAIKNVMLPLTLKGASKRDAEDQAATMLSLVGLKGFETSYPRELSGGMKMRVSIARAFVNRPLILLADEPTGNLDPATGEGIMALLDEINTTGTTVVMATHDHRVVNAMRRRVIQLDRGVIVRDQERGVYE